MKIYITARFKGLDNKPELEALCATVKRSGMDDFCFIRDVENYQHTFDDPQELWSRALAEVVACDALLIDVSDNPSSGRVVEVGIAYALRKPIFVIIRKGVEYKEMYDGLATRVIEYGNYEDIVAPLSHYLTGSNF
jgi:nucleoside 2-deoxyribosyltransferase